MFFIGEMRFYSGNGPEGPEPLFLVTELNSFESKSSAGLGLCSLWRAA